MESVLLLLAGYLLGSVPTAQIAAQLLAGVDLRERSPTISGSGVYYLVARWAVVPVGLIDVLKGYLATVLPLQVGASAELAMACGLAAVVGHNWSLWLGFRGGRGISPFLGFLLVVFPMGGLRRARRVGDRKARAAHSGGRVARAPLVTGRDHRARWIRRGIAGQSRYARDHDRQAAGSEPAATSA